MRQFAALFPGQGSQNWGMGKELYATKKEAQQVFDDANQILGYNFRDLLFQTQNKEIMDTSISQVAIFLTSVAYYNSYIKKYHIVPSYYAGHSVGEIAALVCSKMISFEDGLRFVCRRAKLMQEASDAMGDGAMLAVLGLTYAEVHQMCIELNASGIEVMIANHNDLHQVVLSGTSSDIEQTRKAFEEKGIKTRRLAVKTAFHCKYMESAERGLVHDVEQLKIHMMPALVYSNVTGKPYQDEREVRSLLAIQVTHPVQWYKIIQDIVAHKATYFAEIGQGDVLGNLMLRRKQPDWNVYSLSKSLDEQRFMDDLKRGVNFGSNYLVGRMLGVLISQQEDSNVIMEKSDDAIYDWLKHIYMEHISDSKIVTEELFCECYERFVYLKTKKKIEFNEDEFAV